MSLNIMKRSGGSEHATPATRKQPRQDPVSCQSCRKRKLKCDRLLPCSGCSSRHLECIYHNARPDAVDTPATLVTSPYEPAIARVTPSEPQPQPSVKQTKTSTQDHPRDDSLKTMDWLETIVMGHWVPSAVPAALRADVDQGEQPEVSPGSAPETFSEHLDVVARNRVTRSQSPTDIDLASYLPPQAEAFSLFRYYCENLDFHFHAIIPHHVEQQIRTIYDQKSRQGTIDRNHTALLFSIMASALHYKLPAEPSVPASAYSRTAVFLSGAALIQSNYMAYPTIEGLQATMIITQNLSSTNLPPAVSSLFVPRLSVYQAISMNLHLLDSARSTRERLSNDANTACLELKRRIWWSLVSNDWLLAYLSGPQEWTYSVNPDHMNVRLPRNIEDTRIEHVDEDLPLSIPTAMSYTLCRVQLAQVSRHLVDETASQLFLGKDVPYEKIIELDGMLRDSLDKLPEYYRFGQAHQTRYATLYRERPVFAWQRNMLQLGYHHRICRLHRPHFVRGAKDPKYSCSHVVCLRSARTIIEIKRVMDEDDPVMEPSSSLIWAVMHHVFMAAVILLVDVCFNWEDVLAEKRKEEVIAACRMLTRAQRASPVARRAVDAMMDILRKYWTQERGLKCPQAERAQLETSAEVIDTAAHVVNGSTYVPTSGNIYYATTSQPLPEYPLHEPPLEDMWTEMLEGSACVGLDTPDWTELLNDLTNATFPES